MYMLCYNVTSGSAGKDNIHVLIILQVLKKLQCNKKEGGKGEKGRAEERKTEERKRTAL